MSEPINIPPPPDEFASWLDCATSGWPRCYHEDPIHREQWSKVCEYARVELETLRNSKGPKKPGPREPLMPKDERDDVRTYLATAIAFSEARFNKAHVRISMTRAKEILAIIDAQRAAKLNT